MFRSTEQQLFHALVDQHLAAQTAPLLAQAGTGLGKTRAYLAAAADGARRGARIAVALPSRMLIDQLLASSDLAITRGNLSVAAFRARRLCGSRQEYEDQRAAALVADIMICTSAAVLIDNATGGNYCGAATERMIIFDEADQLPAAAALRADVEITKPELIDLGIRGATASVIVEALLRHQSATAEQRGIARLILDHIREPLGYATAGLTDDGGIALTHYRPGRMLKRVSNRASTVFVSATLQVRGSFDAFRREMGIGVISPLSDAIEPTRHGDLRFVYRALEPDSGEWMAEVVRAVSEAPRPTLVLVNSHDLAARIGAATGGRVRDGDEALRDAAAGAEADGVFIAAGAWAGLDTDTPWASLVIPRVPYDRPRFIEGEPVAHYLDAHATAVRRLAQGVGRVLRRPDASAVVYVLDRRVVAHRLESFVPARFSAAWEAAKAAALRTTDGFDEGARFEVTLTKAERDLALRKAALAKYGHRCTKCAFEPQHLSQLDVHHLNPIAEGQRRTILADVTVLCANCHRLEHARMAGRV
jgi:Rad3-related DNA helicase